MAKRMEPAEWLALVGGVTGLVGQGIRVSGLHVPRQVPELLTVVGVGVFVFGVAFTVREVNKRLTALDTESLARRLDVLAAQVDRRLEALAAAHRVSGTAATIAKVLERAHANPAVVHFKAASGTVNH